MHYFFLKIALLSLVIAIVFILNAGAQTKGFTVTFPPIARVWNPVFQGKPERTFEELEHRLSDATRLGDNAVLEKLLADKLLILGLQHTKAQWIQLVVSGKGTFVNYEKRDMRIQMFGDTVIVTGMQYVDSKSSTGSSSYQYGFMNTWVRSKNGEWQCVAMAADQVKARN